jgi:Predicted nucleic acid-binding protein, contains PIN domain
MYIVDASAFYSLIQSPNKYSELIINGAVLDLTLYELGNVIWKEYKLKRIKDNSKVIDNLTKLLSLMKIIRVNTIDLPEIEDLAIKIGLTFYDASYVYYAKKLGTKILTNDEEMLNKSKETAISIKEF